MKRLGFYLALMSVPLNGLAVTPHFQQTYPVGRAEFYRIAQSVCQNLQCESMSLNGDTITIHLSNPEEMTNLFLNDTPNPNQVHVDFFSYSLGQKPLSSKTQIIQKRYLSALFYQFFDQEIYREASVFAGPPHQREKSFPLFLGLDLLNPGVASFYRNQDTAFLTTKNNVLVSSVFFLFDALMVNNILSGIANVVPWGQAANVAGMVGMRAIMVWLWDNPDYRRVYDSGYHLVPLKEVEEYIQRQKAERAHNPSTSDTTTRQRTGEHGVLL